MMSIPATEAKNTLDYISKDYEDAVQIASARSGKADFIVTRNKVGFTKSPVQIVTPEELCELLTNGTFSG